MTNDLRLIHTQGLDEGIRCAMCTNTMKSDKGCDGGCVVDQKMYEEVLKVIDKALEAQPCIEDYPTCTECEHYDREKHYCPRFCQVIKDTLAEAQSTDAVSREAVLEEISDFYEKGYNGRGMFSRIKALPSVTPQFTDEEIDKAQAVEQAYVDKMVELAVEEVKRPKGKWIVISCEPTDIFKCSECGMRVVNPYKYCPNCGSYNGGEEDGEDSACD